MKTIFLWLIALMFLGSGLAYAGDYTDSAHGNSGYGVDRTSTSQYTEGHCAHCHEQHASIDGGTPADPAPNTGNAAGPDGFCLLALNFDTSATPGSYAQDDNACFFCHTSSASGISLQTDVVDNNNYAATFGGDSVEAAGIFQAFNLASYHNLNDVLNVAKTNWSSTFTANSNPCSGCHNVHIAQRSGGKPIGSYDPTKSAISRPSDHNELWGDTDGSADKERMDEYAAATPAATYRAPFYVGADPALQTTTREPDGASRLYSSANGFNLTNFVTFCLDCHSSAIGSVSAIPWGIDDDEHGKGFDSGGTTKGSRGAPFTTDGTSGGSEANTTNFVLSCMDCHEPHGSSNSKLLRTEVNNTSGITTGTGENELYFENFCQACHTNTHRNTEECGSCHVHGGNF